MLILRSFYFAVVAHDNCSSESNRNVHAKSEITLRVITYLGQISNLCIFIFVYSGCRHTVIVHLYVIYIFFLPLFNYILFCIKAYLSMAPPSSIFLCSINQTSLLLYGWIKLVRTTIHKKHTIITAFRFVIHLASLLTNGVVLVRSLEETNLLTVKLRLSSKVCKHLFIFEGCIEVLQWSQWNCCHYWNFLFCRKCGEDYYLSIGAWWTKGQAV